MQTPTRKLARLLIGILAVAAVVACGGAGSTTATSPTSTGTGGAYQGPVDSSSKSSAGGVVKPAIGVPVASGPRVIKNAQLTVEVRNGTFDSTLDRMLKITTDLGGVVSGSSATAVDTGSLRTGTISFEIPADKFTLALSEVRQLGKVQNLSIGGQDVSAQYVDLQARLKNAEAQRDAMLAILSRAQNISDIIQVQNQLGQITGEIEQLKGQIDFLDHGTTYSTISVSMHEAAVSADTWGLGSSWSQAVHGFVNTLNFIVVGLGAAGPVLLLLLLGLGIWRFRRRLAL